MLDAAEGQARVRGNHAVDEQQARFDFGDELDRVLTLMQRYAGVPMSLADACLVRMSETLADPVIVTTDTDFNIYRRHGRQVIPSMTPY